MNGEWYPEETVAFETAQEAAQEWGPAVAAGAFAGPIGELDVRQAGLPIPLIIKGAKAVIPWAKRAVPWLLGGAAAMSIFGDEDEGGGQQQQIVPFEGPGLREPAAEYVLKEWKIRCDSKEGDFNLQFYLTQMPGGRKRIYMYSQRTRSWKSWGMPRLAIIGKNLPSHKQLSRLRGNLSRHSKDARLILKLVSPHSLREPKHHGHYSRARG